MEIGLATKKKIVFATNNKHKLEEIRAILGPQFEVISLSEIGCNEDIPETGQTLEENALQKAEYVYNHYHLSCFADDTGLEVEALNGAPGVYSARYASMEPAAAVAPDGKPSGTVAAGMELAGEVAPDGKPSGTVAAGMEPAGAVAPDGKPLGTVAAAASHDSEANMARLLRELGNNNNRRARFRTVIALIEKRDICPCGCTSIKQIHRFEGIVEGEITREKSGAEGFGYDPIFRPDGYDKTFAELGADIKNQISHRARATQKLAEYLKKK